MAPTVLIVALDLLFAVSALAALWAIVGTWLSVRHRVAGLRDEMASARRAGSYRYRVTTHTTRLEPALVYSMPIHIRPAPARSWPELRAAA